MPPAAAPALPGAWYWPSVSAKPPTKRSAFRTVPTNRSLSFALVIATYKMRISSDSASFLMARAIILFGME
jgi:hypothetical protein